MAMVFILKAKLCCFLGICPLRSSNKLHSPACLLKAKLASFQVLGFGEYIEEVYAAYEQHKHETMVLLSFS